MHNIILPLWAVIVTFVCNWRPIVCTNCSAINSYIFVASPNSLRRTILSAQALFEPYVYYVEQTPLVQLSSADDACSEGGISTIIKDRIVLIEEQLDGCSYATRVYYAQMAGAKAVILASDEKALWFVVPVEDDNPNDNIAPTIPTRIISYSSAVLLSSQLDTTAIEIEFGCLEETAISPTLCVLDTTGDFWWMDGDYQYQADITMNNHAVWIKTGYPLLGIESLYLFLHTADNADKWYWAITEDSTMQNDQFLRAKCNTNGIDDPSLCRQWSTTDFYTSGTDTFSVNLGFKVNASLCAISDNYLCIHSDMSELSGLFGTYRQWNKYTPYWFREWVDCDTNPGYIMYQEYGSYGAFELIDPFDSWTIAQCKVSDYSSAEREDYYQFHPELCTQWYSLPDGSLDVNHKLLDNTLSIETNVCVDQYCPKYDIVPLQLCMSRNNIMHSFLEGDYELTGYTGQKYKTPEYKRSKTLTYMGETVPVYVWYYAELDDTFKWWVISSNDLQSVLAGGSREVYGYCASNTRNPASCVCWNFYFAAAEAGQGGWHSDCKFELTDSECVENGFNYDHLTFPDFVCSKEVFKSDQNGTYIYDGKINLDTIIGGYYKKDDDALELSGDVPYYWKPPNNYINETVYIYYDEFYGYWEIGTTLHGTALLTCMEDEGDYLPTHCSMWYDKYGLLVGNIYLYSDNCGSEDVIKHNKDGTDRTGKNRIVVLILIAVILIAILITAWFYCKNRKQRRAFGFTRPSSTDDVVRGDLGLGDDADGQLMTGHSSTKDKPKQKVGAYDMTQLNTGDDDDGEDIDDQSGDTNDEDDGEDDTSVDKQQHGIDDSDEQQLIEGGDTRGNGDSDDPDLGPETALKT